MGFFVLRSCSIEGGGPQACSGHLDCVHLRKLKAGQLEHMTFYDKSSSTRRTFMSQSELYLRSEKLRSEKQRQDFLGPSLLLEAWKNSHVGILFVESWAFLRQRVHHEQEKVSLILRIRPAA